VGHAEEIAPDEADTGLSFETLLVDLSARFINAPAHRLDAAIEDAQRQICEHFQIERVTLWERSPVPDCVMLTHAYESPTDYPRIRNLLESQFAPPRSAGPHDAVPLARLQMNAQATLPWIFAQLRAGKTVAISSLTQLPAQAQSDRECLRNFGTMSIVSVPLWMGHEWFGCLNFATRATERTWAPVVIRRFELMGHLFTNALIHRAADAAIRENESRLRAIFDTAVEGIVTTDARGIIESVNRAVAGMFGYEAAELTGQNVRILLPPPFCDEYDQFMANDQEVRQPKAIWRGRELLGQRKDGTVFPIELAVSESILGTRRIYTGLVRDITERKKVEESLRDAEQAARDLSGRLINALEEERSRLARELHDDVTQRLARLAIDLGRLQRAATSGAEIGELVGGVRDGLLKITEDVHALSYELHPAVLIDLGLDDALKAECDNLSKRLAVPTTLKLRSLPEAIPRDVAIGLFRIAQESLRNAVRHGRPSRVDVLLWGVDGGLQLAVRDDGIGFDPAARRGHPSLGLASMRERARLLGGELDVESQPGHGTTIIAWVPLRE
jgi:PAS domain S-box-containing protein